MLDACQTFGRSSYVVHDHGTTCSRRRQSLSRRALPKVVLLLLLLVVGAGTTSADESASGLCGNDAVDLGEACDGDSRACTAFGGYPGARQCNAQCTGYDPCITDLFCGDGSVDGNELCDRDRDRCTTLRDYTGERLCNDECTGYGQCTSSMFCGDGARNGSEICDGNDRWCTAIDGYTGRRACDETCNGYGACESMLFCGDGFLNGNELCDGQGQDCTVPGGYPGTQDCNDLCRFDSCTTTLFCGDGSVDGNEVCDDGGLNGEPNRCNQNCTGTTRPECGNGVVEDGEECDAGPVPTPQCNVGCQLTTCGDGKIQNPNGHGVPEVCDGNTQVCSDMGYRGAADCADDCLGYDSCIPFEFCGDGEINGEEICDDGGLNGLPNQCDDTCTGSTPAVCGNDIVEPGEECDDGGTDPDDGCSAVCRTEYCGDGICQAPEDTFACGLDCSPPETPIGGAGGQVDDVLMEAARAGIMFHRGPGLVYDALDGSYNINTIDTLISRYLDNGLLPVPFFKCLDFDEDLVGTGLMKSTLPADVEGWQSFVRLVVDTHKDNLHIWTIDVEYPRVWVDNPSSSNTKETWIEYVRLTHEAIKEADPSALVIMALSNMVVPAFCDGYIDEPSILSPASGSVITIPECGSDAIADSMEWVRAALTGAIDYYDGIDLHPYGYHQFIPAQAAWVRDQLGLVGRELWALEGGGPFTGVGEIYTPEEEASYLVKSFTLGLHAGMKGMIWGVYKGDWGSSFGEEFTNLSLLDLEKVRKPAFYSYEQMTGLLSGFTSVEKLDLHPEAQTYRFTVDGESVHVLWSETGARIELPIGVASATGRLVTTTTSAAQQRFQVFAVDGIITLDLRPVPIYLMPDPE